MCGIAGVLDTRRRAVDPSLLRMMCDALRHRGPDDQGYHLSEHVGLGHRRLSIIDLSLGRQPLANEDGTVWVSFNGEIYNFQRLRAELEGTGHQFATHSDTEVIVHAYEQYGAKCLSRFRGMFAFALWDARRQSLLLARDRIGKKPLFYAEVDGQFVFASELQALVRHPAIARDPDPTAIDDFLTYGYVPAPKTVFQDVRKLLPGHYLTVDLAASPDGRAAIHLERYWELQYEPKLTLGVHEAAEGLLEVLTEAVRLRMIADVPLGALLSGGVDSSVVVALMSRLTSQRVKTFSIGFAEQEFNELPYARAVAERYDTEHHELIVHSDAIDVLPKLVRHYGEPFADSSALPTYQVARLTRQHVKVALNGDGADECFAGYERYLACTLADRYQQVPGGLRRWLVEPLVALIPDTLPRRSRLRQVKSALAVATQPLPQRYLRWMTYFTPEQKRDLYSPDFRRCLGGYDGRTWLLSQFGWDGASGATRPEEHLDALLHVDVRSYLAYDLLVKMDIATMAHSLEARSPFLDHEVMEYCARLPTRFKIRGTTLKYLLRKVGGDLLPAASLRRRKMGFGPPVAHWMRGELRPLLQEVLLSPAAGVRDYFAPGAVQGLVQDHVDGRRDYSFQLWALLWLELWHREFVDPAGDE